jgi:iron-sulfur cluster repair protein YtfE (RIC family)
MAIDHSGFPREAPGFETPLEMLIACHGRIRDHCATLLRVRTHVAAHGADAAAGGAAHGVVHYFDRGARDHHVDEEEDLFPALIESMAGSDPVCIRDLADALTAEHRELERLWAPVRAWLGAVAMGKSSSPAPAEIEPFVALYERHAAREEAELFPMAQRLLESEALAAIGQSMRRRRGVK